MLSAINTKMGTYLTTASVVSTAVQLALGLTVGFVSSVPWSCYNATFLILAAGLSLANMSAKYRNWSGAGQLEGFVALTHLGHAWGMLLVACPHFSPYKTTVDAVIYLPAAVVMGALSYTHHCLYLQPSTTYPRKTLFRVFAVLTSLLGVAAWGCAMPYFGNPDAPSFCLDGMIGLICSGLMMATLCSPRYRASRWSWVMAGVWASLSCGLMVCSAVRAAKDIPVAGLGYSAHVIFFLGLPAVTIAARYMARPAPFDKVVDVEAQDPSHIAASFANLEVKAQTTRSTVDESLVC